MKPDSREFFDNMKLPKANPKGELERISENNFLPLFDVSKFELRQEYVRDTGIDFSVEVKYNQKHSNFRCSIQLKATNSKKRNKDGSISFSIKTSNIEYLLNGATLAYYVLYHVKEDRFFYENAHNLRNSLIEEKPNWDSQMSHSIRFINELDSGALEEIYQDVIDRGMLNRRLGEKIAVRTSLLESGNRISIGADLQVTSDFEIKSFIEDNGLQLINEGRWEEIIHQVRRSSVGTNWGAKGFLVLGIAYYYNGNLLDASKNFDKAQIAKNDLSAALRNHLGFFDATVKLAFGVIDEEKYNSEFRKLDEDKNHGQYLKLMRIKQDFVLALSTSVGDDAYDKYEAELTKIEESTGVSTDTKLIVKNELLFIEGNKINDEYGAEIMSKVENDPNYLTIEMITNELEQSLGSRRKEWVANVTQLKKSAIDQNRLLSYHMVLVNEVKILYHFEALKMVLARNVTHEVETSQDWHFDPPKIENMHESLNSALVFYEKLGFRQNAIAVLAIRYELFHLENDFDTASKIIVDIENLLESTYDKEQIRKLNLLKKSGTTHERIEAMMVSLKEKGRLALSDSTAIVQRMKKMDHDEWTSNPKQRNGDLHIELFPIGKFAFPKNEMQKLFEILRIEDANVKANFVDFWNLNGPVPIANIFCSPIMGEGRFDGNLHEKGIESWHRIFEIRKALFENNFFRCY